VSVALGLLGTAMLLLSVKDRFWPERAEVTPMTGDVNVAVAEFGSLGSNGRVTVTDESSALASSVFEVLDRELLTLEAAPADGEPFDFEIRPPEETGVVDGDTNDERAAQAARIADDIDADVIVYAVLDESDGSTSATPEFFLTNRNLVADAQEMVGQYQLGIAVEQQALIATDINARRAIRSVLLDRANGLVQLIVGLSHYGARDYGTAIRVFAEIDRLQLMGIDDGAEILHLFLGNAAGRVGDLVRAESAYRRALEIDRGFARAQVGLAETTFQRAHNDCAVGAIDADGVRRSIDLYLAALEAEHQPVRSNIPAKVALGAGRGYLCLSLAGIEDAWASAREHLSQVVDAHEAGADDIDELAAEASSNLGLLEIQTSDGDPEALDRATQALLTAIELGSQPGSDSSGLPGWYGMLGYAYCRLDRDADALRAYDQALAAYDRAGTSAEGSAATPVRGDRQSYVEARARAADGDPASC
jgi:tetratricopeptide (TPR) repeat protein